MPEGCIRLDMTRPCFPSLDSPTDEERAALRDLISKHPEYLANEIWCSKAVIQ
jgi:hypothetical protein